jgi:ubiquinone biosynthesis protein
VLKLGQIASTRPDLIGAVWAAELSLLQDRVPAVDSTAIVARIEAEMGQSILDAFISFDPVPVAAASLAQVHRAVLADGRVVAVKVQVPGIDEVIAADIAALRMLAGALAEVVPFDVAQIADELDRALTEELDYGAEAAATTAFAGELRTAALFVPAVVPDRSTARVLTTEFVDGARLTDALNAASPSERTRMIVALCDDLGRQVFRTGRIHADPHPGNFLVTADGRIAVLDFGCTLTLTADERHGYARLLAALATGDRATALIALATLGFGGDPDALAAMAVAITDALRPGVQADAIDWETYSRSMAREIASRARAAGVTIPRSFVLLGRVLGTMAGLIAAYKPNVQLHAVIGPHVAAALATN